jgi:nucleotide-binding universal stress UspA family protein
MYKRILVPLDGSELAEQALPHAIFIAECIDAELVLLRVIEPFPSAGMVPASSIKSVKSQARTWAREYFEEITPKVRAKGVPVRTEILEGRPGLTITQYAVENQIDMIVICSRGRTGLTRWLLGSVADRILRGTTVPVFMIPAVGEAGPEGL